MGASVGSRGRNFWDRRSACSWCGGVQGVVDFPAVATFPHGPDNRGRTGKDICHCPQIGWTICRHLDRLNVDDEHFLWREDGVYSASIVSPDERAELRAEDERLFVAAAIEHPWLTIRQMSLNLARQLSMFTLGEYMVPSWATYTSSDMTLWLRPSSEPLWQTIWSGVIYAVVFASLGYLMLLTSRGLLTRDQADFFILAMTTAWLAALAGALSDVKPRYEARAIWLIPLAATLVFVSRRPEGLLN